MRFVIDDIVTTFTNKIHSHKSAWPRMQKCLLEDNGLDVTIAFDKPDTVHDNIWLISTPMEFKGDVFNLFGGYTIDVKNRINRLLHHDKDKIIALEKPIPDIESILRKRAEKTDFNFTDTEWSYIKSLQDCPIIKHEDLVTHDCTVVIGDSHSISRYSRNTLVSRNDGLTLYGLLSRNIESYLPINKIKHLIINAGNVDIRHHLARQIDPIESARKLISDLKTQLVDLQHKGLIETFEVTSPYPIEFEERKIPKSGWYKGSGFYGSWDLRNKIRQFMTYEMINKFENVYLWPEEWYQISPKDYAAIYMEKPQSVHLSPEFYQWDLVNNELNNRGILKYE